MAAELKKRIFAEFVEDYAILRMRNGENRLNSDTVERLMQVLEEIKSYKDVKFLVTIGANKFFSNGLDLQRLQAAGADHYGLTFLPKFYQMLQMIMTFPVPTIAALNGHAFAAGFFVAMVHDYRIMRTQQGWMCLPEINLKLQFTKGLMSFLRMKIPNPRVAVNAIIMGKRFNAEQALAAGFVDEICPMEKLLNNAVKMGKDIVKGENYDRDFMEILKSDLHENVLRDMGEVLQSFKSKL